MSNPTLNPESILGVVDVPIGHWLTKLPSVGPLAGAVLLIAAAFIDYQDRASFYFAYFAAFVFFLSIALGALGFVLVQHATRSGWSVAVRRLAEATMGAMPSLAALFFVAGFGFRYLYPWIFPSLIRTEPSIGARFPYFKEQIVLLRSAIYFAIWLGAAWFFRNQSADQDITGDPAISRRLRRWAPLAMLLVALTTSSAAFDWLMTFDPRWQSPLFGLYFLVGSAIAGLSWIVLLGLGLQRLGFVRLAIGAAHWQRLGAGLIGALALWWLVVLSQLLATRFTGLDDESRWLAVRWAGGWGSWSLLLLLGNGLAIAVLASAQVRRRATAIGLVAGWLLLLRAVDCWVLVWPARGHLDVRFVLVAAGAWLGVAGLVAGVISHLLVRESLVAERDPRLPESIALGRN